MAGVNVTPFEIEVTTRHEDLVRADYLPDLENTVAAYLIIEGEVTDKERWTAYSHAVVPLIAKFGGKHLNAPGGARTLEGGHEDWIVALFGFESMDDIERFWNSPEYVPVKAIRQGAATLRIKAVSSA